MNGAALTILPLVQAGLSPWDGWDRGLQPWDAKARSRAYGRRRELIQTCRTTGLLDKDGLVTEAGIAALRAQARTEAVVV